MIKLASTHDMWDWERTGRGLVTIKPRVSQHFYHIGPVTVTEASSDGHWGVGCASQPPSALVLCH